MPAHRYIVKGRLKVEHGIKFANATVSNRRSYFRGIISNKYHVGAGHRHATPPLHAIWALPQQF